MNGALDDLFTKPIRATGWSNLNASDGGEVKAIFPGRRTMVD